jgi:molybdopterin/thiamine biosynthesis adenylyltransferase
MSEARYHRNVMLFGEEGQRKLRQTKVVIAGVGGLGSPLAQHMALLGVEEVGLIDDEELDDTNRNRFIGARADDPVPGSPKVSLAARLIHEINPQVRTRTRRYTLVTPESFELIKAADWVFGCFDEDGPRFILNEICAAYAKSYADLASDVPASGEYGGRICVSHEGDGCLHCLGLLDEDDVNNYLRSTEERARIAAIYGVPVAALGQTGPSVSPLNGVIASLAATEFMVAVTGMRKPSRVLQYRGHLGTVNTSRDQPDADCFYCRGIRGEGAGADIERYLRIPHLRKARKAD